MQTRRAVVRRHGGVRHRLAVTGVLACFVVALYVAVVLGGGVLIGQTDSPSLLLSVVATVGVALLFAPVQAAIERIASRAGHPASATPYDVLSRFSEPSRAATEPPSCRHVCPRCSPRGRAPSGRRCGSRCPAA